MFYDLDYLLKNLEILKDYLKSEEKNLVNNKNINNLRKVIDHIKLEHYRNMNLDDKIGKEVEKILNENMNSIDNQIFE